MTIAKAKPPKTKDEALLLLERYAAKGGELAAIEAGRREALAATNAVADSLASPLLEEMATIAAQLEPWWAKAATDLTGGKRKSVELGGCMIGTKLGRAVLDHSLVDDKAALAALQAHRWAKPLVRVTCAIDRAATLKALSGVHGSKLTELGFHERAGEEAFFVERVDQAGVVSKA